MTETEAVVASTFTAILGVEGVRPEDDIFELGGDSMQAVQIALLLETRFGVEIPIETFDSSARLRDVAAFIDDQKRGGAAS